MNKTAGILIALLAAAAGCRAQADSTVSRHVTTAIYMIGAGPTEILDTYLSHEHFSGTGLTFLAETERKRQGSRWSTVMRHQADMAITDNRGGTADEMAGTYSFAAGCRYGWSLSGDRLRLQAGGIVCAEAGFIYNTVNGNNPAQARLSIGIMPSGTATYRFRLWNRNMTARYGLDLPLAGIMFSPNYGQSYYEIFSRGDYDHNIVPTTFVSAPNFRQMLTLDVGIGRKTTLRVGYLGDYRQAKVNNIRSHIYSHRFMIGVARSFKLTHYRP